MSFTIKKGNTPKTFCTCDGCGGLFHQGEGRYSLKPISQGEYGYFLCKNCRSRDDANQAVHYKDIKDTGQ